MSGGTENELVRIKGGLGGLGPDVLIPIPEEYGRRVVQSAENLDLCVTKPISMMWARFAGSLLDLVFSLNHNELL